MWDLPGPGREPMSAALAGGFLITAPPGKSLLICVDFIISPATKIKRGGGGNFPLPDIDTFEENVTSHIHVVGKKEEYFNRRFR